MTKKPKPKPTEPLPKPDPNLRLTDSPRSGGVDIDAQRVKVGGDVAGRDIIKNIVNNSPTLYFVNNYEPLEDAYINPRPIFERTHLEHFSGREWLRDRVNSFLRTHDCGYFILEAEAGLGKTTFLAWLAREQGYIHHFVERAPGPDGVETGLKNLAAQLILAYELGSEAARKVVPQAATRPDYLSTLLTQAADQRHEGEKIVLIVDALDLAGTPQDQNVLGLPATLPKGVFIIVSQRPVYVNLQVEMPTTPREVLHLRATDQHNQADMQLFLEQVVTWPGVAQALQDNRYPAVEFIQLLLKKCNGIWVYLHYVIYEIERDKRFSLDLETLPEGLTRYYANIWQHWRKRREEWNRAYLPLLATLAAAREGLTLDRLASWSGLANQREKISFLLEDWRPFIAIAAKGQQDHYSFYHATLHEFFEGKVERGNLTEGEKTMVSELERATNEARLRIIKLLHEEMQSSAEPEACREAAFSLIHMDWLSHNPSISPDELLAYLDLIARYVDTSFEYSYLKRHITMMLESTSVTLSKRQKAQLLVYRAAMLGQLGELDGAIEDYAQAGTIADEFVESGDCLLEDLRLTARIKIGHANIIVIRYEQAAELKEQPRHQDELQIAVSLYLQAIKLAQAYGRDVVLELGIYLQLSYAHTLLQNWKEAEQTCTDAFALLRRIEDREDQVLYRARALETVSELHVRKGQSTIPPNSLAALREYETAYRSTQEEIDLLEDSSIESFDLVTAHNNAGGYLLAMSNCPDCKEPQLLTNACGHWQAALDMARRLDFVDLARDASTYLEQHCANSKV